MTAFTSLTDVLELCPQLTEQAIVDFVNGLDVIDGAVVAQKSQNKNFVSQLWSVISGSKARQQNLINEHVANDFRIIKDYILTNETKHQANDLALSEISRGIGKIADKLKAHNADISELKSLQTQSLNQLDTLSQQLKHHQAFIFAQTELDNTLTSWEAGKLDGFTPEQALIVVYHRLYWGKFGTWLRLTNQSDSFQQQGRQMLETLENRCLIILNNKTSRRSNQLIDRPFLSKRLNTQDPMLNDVLAFMSSNNNAALLRLTHEANVLTDAIVFDNDMPFVFSNHGLVSDAVSSLKGYGG